jgi:hypothetical protein
MDAVVGALEQSLEFIHGLFDLVLGHVLQDGLDLGRGQGLDGYEDQGFDDFL